MGELVVDFHRGVHSGKLSKAHALQQAQRALAADPRSAQPCLLGAVLADWQLALGKQREGTA